MVEIKRGACGLPPLAIRDHIEAQRSPFAERRKVMENIIDWEFVKMVTAISAAV